MITFLIVGGIFIVDSPSDVPDASVGDGICATPSGECTLRAAVQEANAISGEDTITFSVNAVTLDSTIHVNSAIQVLGNTTVDSIFCPFAGACISARSGSVLTMANLYVEAQGDGILSNDGHLYVRTSTIVANVGAPVYLYGVRASVFRNSSIVSRGGLSHAVIITLVPETDSVIVRNSRISSSNACIYSGYSSSIPLPAPPRVELRSNRMECGYGIVNRSVGYSIPFFTISSNEFYIDRRGATAIHLEGCYGCLIGSNLLLGTDTSGYFIYLKNVHRSTIRGNTNMDGTLYTDAGRYQLVLLENSDSNVISGNVWAFSSLKDSTGGINIIGGSDYNVVDSNYVENVLWGGISIYDSSSYNTFYGDTLINTGGIQLRPYWKGRYAFPFMIDTVYTGRVGKGNLFRKVYSLGTYNAMNVAGMDSTVVDSSVMDVSDAWGIAIVNAGSKLYVYNSLMQGASTPSFIGGYGISLEYYYGRVAKAAEYADDVLPQIFVENTEFRDFAYAFRVMDMDTSYVKLDTLFDDNGNTITGNTYGYHGGYFLPVIVQTFDTDCNMNTTAIDSVVLVDRAGGRMNLTKLSVGEALWSFHWEPYSTVIYDSLHTWYPVGNLYYDGAGTIGTTNPYTVILYGENGRTVDYALDVERGLANHVDPCPASGYPKTVDSRWLVLKVQYDPDYLPVSDPEEGAFRLVVGRYQIPVSSGDVVRVFSPSGRMVKVLRVEGDTRMDLRPGLYLVKVSNRTYKIPVF